MDVHVDVHVYPTDSWIIIYESLHDRIKRTFPTSRCFIPLHNFMTFCVPWRLRRNASLG